jgi:dihydroflavonol-4-reductase
MDRGAPGRRYLLGSHNVSYREVMSLAAAWAGRRPPAFAAPDLLLRAAGLLARPLVRRDPARFAGLDERVLAGIREARHRNGDRARRELGVPVTPLAVTVSRALNWFRAHGYLS